MGECNTLGLPKWSTVTAAVYGKTKDQRMREIFIMEQDSRGKLKETVLGSLFSLLLLYIHPIPAITGEVYYIEDRIKYITIM